MSNKHRLFVRKYGLLQPLEFAGPDKVSCRCDCGTVAIYRIDALYAHHRDRCSDCVRRARLRRQYDVRPDLLVSFSVSEQDEILRAWRAHVRRCYRLKTLPATFERFVIELTTDPDWGQPAAPVIRPDVHSSRNFIQYR